MIISIGAFPLNNVTKKFLTKTSIMQQLKFELNAEFIELNNLLKVMGICDSGGAGKQLVAQGCVYVNGQQELRKTCKIRAGQIVRIGGIQINVINRTKHSP